MNKYEIALVLSSRIDDEARTATLERLKHRVERSGSTITDIDERGKQKLAYEIQDMAEGYYYFVHFEGPDEAPAYIESHIRIYENVIRFLIVRQDA
ncbi:MAG: 30S ribosomal protein S6 [Eubacterium sp.]|nr:30S ribosomal protein S6 [Eubacterium sp.]